MSNENNEKVYQQNVLNIFKKLLGVKEDKRVAEIIGIIPEELANRKRRKTLTQTLFVEAVKRGMDLNLLFYPDEFEERKEEKIKKTQKPAKKIAILNQINEWLDEIVSENPKKEIWFEVEFEDKFHAFKKWKEEKEEQEAERDNTSARKVA